MANMTKQFEKEKPILLDQKGLQDACHSGRYTAEKIARAAGARVQIGRRVFYNRQKIENFLNQISE